MAVAVLMLMLIVVDFANHRLDDKTDTRGMLRQHLSTKRISNR